MEQIQSVINVLKVHLKTSKIITIIKKRNVKPINKINMMYPRKKKERTKRTQETCNTIVWNRFNL